MSDQDDPDSTIPWPGFVDILSTVIIVFVFFMMMTSVIIFVLSEQAKKTAVNEAQKQTQSEDAKKKSQSDVDQKDIKNSTEKTLSPDVSNLLMEKEALQKEINRLTQLKNVLSESQSQDNKREGNVVYVTFGDMGATITKPTEDFIQKQMPFEGHIVLTSIIPKGSDFASIREIALNRALNIRNVLLQSGVPNDHIALKIISQADESKENTKNVYGSVTLTFKK